MSQGLQCGKLDAEIEKKEQIREWEDNTRMPCPDGLIAFCTDRMDGCGAKRWHKPVKYYCVSPRDIW